MDENKIIIINLSKGRVGEANANLLNSERATSRNLVGISCAHDQRAQSPQFLVQQSDGVVDRIVRAKRVGADKFRTGIG